MNTDQQDVDLILAAVRTSLPGELIEWPGGWPDQIEAALIDAVLSIRAKYGQPHNGVRGAVGRYREVRQTSTLDDLDGLASFTPVQLSETLGNSQGLSGGSTKAEGIINAARNLVDAGVHRAAEISDPTLARKRAYTQVRGLGVVTWEYFLMLLGIPGVKADTWVLRFAEQTLGRKTSPAEARGLILAAATKLHVDPSRLDHAIWAHMRKRDQVRPKQLQDLRGKQ
ncbi:hypothetical protein [Phytoactinopolyspora endophytica]|uniref:hypothetical protein n=1 Tax=Phytoactinopolyspora endophytica TaxID=1642495 RepID=UPI00101D5F19|nr:hypothetical protein [Phytoactinopolyspora endophytica]